MKTIYLAGGCFWCTEAIFKSLRGVQEVTPGYMGGTVAQPSYEAVSSGKTGHAETVKIIYDETIISLRDILEVFFATHDPTTPNRQGHDIGSQYRSAIFIASGYRDDTDVNLAHEIVEEVQRSLPEDKRVTTEILTAGEFYSAEEYHQNYYTHHPDAPYCQVVIDPKIKKLKKDFSDKIYEA